MSEDSKKELKIKTFHKIFNELLNDISIIKPNDQTLIWVKSAISFLEPATLIDQFMSYIDAYADKILNKDESFFMNELHKDVEENSFASREINKITDIWKDPSTTDYTKECIWKYFILLLKLGKSIKKD